MAFGFLNTAFAEGNNYSSNLFENTNDVGQFVDIYDFFCNSILLSIAKN